MTFAFDVRGNLDGLAQALQVADRDRAFVTALALNNTATEIKNAIVDQMGRVFDRPTRFTLNALQVRRASKTDLNAAVEFKQGYGSIPARRYLGPEVEGGPRSGKSFERALQSAGILRSSEFTVPAVGARLDGYGNMRGSDLSRILSQLRASPDAAQNATRSRRSRKSRRAGPYFVVRGKSAPDGIYQRVGTREIIPVILFVRQPSYEKRLPFYQTAELVTRERFAANYERAVAASDAFAAFRR